MTKDATTPGTAPVSPGPPIPRSPTRDYVTRKQETCQDQCVRHPRLTFVLIQKHMRAPSVTANSTMQHFQPCAEPLILSRLRHAARQGPTSWLHVGTSMDVGSFVPQGPAHSSDPDSDSSDGTVQAKELPSPGARKVLYMLHKHMGAVIFVITLKAF